MRIKRKKENPMSCKTFLASLILILIFRNVSAQNYSETRSYMKTFPVGKETSLEVTNKYGTIEITSWKKDSAYIRAEIKAYASKQEKLGSLFDGIAINLNGGGSILRAETNFTQNFSRLFESFKGMTSKIISYDSRVEIDYYINVPEYLNLRIENKYGDIYMENCSGNLTVSISNGNFKANSLNRESSINMSFCDAVINSISSGKIDASFSEIDAEKIGILSINSISSKYNIRNAGELKIVSRRDKFYIDNIESISGNSYFTDYNIKTIKKEINLETRYGNLDAESIEKGFESVNLNSGYSDITLDFDDDASYSLNIRHINTFVVLPSKNIKSEEKTLDEEKKEYVTYGSVGNNPGSAKVKIDATRGKIYLK
jgi:hypothetical protein